MKINFFAILAILLFSSEVRASPYLEEMENLGYVSGEGLACRAKRYPSYELIARAYMVTKAKSDEELTDGMYAYNQAKVSSYMKRRASGYIECGNINRIFNQQQIFKSRLYKNGTIKTPDGKILKPRYKYDARLLFDRKEDEKSKLDAYYEKTIKMQENKAKKEGVYQKIRRQELRNRY